MGSEHYDTCDNGDITPKEDCQETSPVFTDKVKDYVCDNQTGPLSSRGRSFEKRLVQ